MQVVFRPEARTELIAARDWYDEQVIGLGMRFVEQVMEGVALLETQPQVARELEPGVRYLPLRRFPYSLIYRIDTDVIVVLSCFHQRRAEGSWKAG